MGTVSRMLRNRAREAASKPTWEMLWFPATFVAYSAAAVLMPRSGPLWVNAVRWACFAVGWVIFVAAADHLVGRRRRRQLAEAGAPRRPRYAWRFATYMVLCMLSVQLSVLRLELPPLVVLPAFAVVAVLAVAAQAIAKRRDAERRRREVDELAQRF